MSLSLDEINQTVAPLQIRYSSMVPLGLSAKSKRVSFFPSNAGVFTQNSIIRIPISSSSCFLDGTLSCLKMTYKNIGAGINQFDNSAHSLIQSVRVVSRAGGQDLENIRHYGQLIAMLSDLQLNDTDRLARYHEGYGAGSQGNDVASVCAVPTDNVAANIKISTDSGLTALNNKTLSTYMGTNEPSLAQNASMTVYLPLLSAVIGSSQSKYLPLFLVGQIDLEIQLSPTATVGAVACDYQVSDVEFQTQLIEFSGDLNSRLMAMCSKSGLCMHGTSWFCDKVSVGAGNQSVLVSERLRSVKSLFTYMSVAPAACTDRRNARLPNTVVSFQLKCGSNYFPNQPITGGSAAGVNGGFISETMKAIGNYGNIHAKPLMNAVNFVSDTKVAGSVGRAIYGIDLDAFVERDAIESGMDFVNNNPTNINLIGTGAGIVACDVFVHILHDILLTIDTSFVLSVRR